MDFKGLSNAVTNTPSLLPSMGITRRKMVLAQSSTNGPRSLSRTKASTHSPSPAGSHTAAYTPKQGAFRMGVVSLLSERSARSPTSPGRVSERQVLPLWGLGRVLPKNAESLRNSDALMRVAVPRRRGPAGLRDLFSFLSKLRLVYPALRAFPCVRGRGGITTLGALHVLLKRWAAACQKGSFAVF